MFLSEWLKQVGFQEGNPFALKQADEEGDLLQEYFVEHPAYMAILDTERPRSSILHAPRGSGKSTTRRMFEDYCRAHAERLRPLLVPLLEWQPIMGQLDGGSAGGAQAHTREIFRHAVAALADDAGAAWVRDPSTSDLAGYLNWICTTHDTYLTPAQRRALAERGWRQDSLASDLALYDMGELPLAQRLETFMRVIRSIGYKTCYVLIDRIDELLETAADWAVGADLLAPLIGNLRLIEIPGLAFKCFVPTEVVEVLQGRRVLREDRIGCFSMQWSGAEGQQLLETILRNRLTVFSDGNVPGLASIAAPQLRDLDKEISAAALGSPRHLLNLGEWLFQACAADADENNLFIQPKHFDAARQRLRNWIERNAPPADTTAQQEPASIRQPEARDAQPEIKLLPALDADGVQILRLQLDGSIWRGHSPIEGWEVLPVLQRSLLEYLYDNRGKLCRKKDILNTLWDEPVGDDTLRKLVVRLIEFVEPDPEKPIYVQRIHGGHLRLDHADA